ncbi:uncharacterized protein E0L32_011127 [Thyridium curvatum]|uniref:Uncharacterized protein n=1 Tax=Thyridium curvatum TaxID=1093900 RepID=A0A507AEU5_9PEZI|nr:uncharacterized protein E0L32_011127 [Thyridium curvatum]TPX06982.1 hypothetical protein E0L32_011127 [Thyridium curvatum]
MLEHLSPKFKMPPMEREPRAALILNRFTRNLTVMFATNAVSSILGLRPDQIKDLSFYRCIQENCLPEALRCLESAKANDSIAYLRFWFRDPRAEEDFSDTEMEAQEDGNLSCSTSDSESGGAQLDNEMDLDSEDDSGPEIKVEREPGSPRNGLLRSLSTQASERRKSYQGSDGESTAVPTAFSNGSGQAVHNNGALVNSGGAAVDTRRQLLPSIELEAVVSCTSDGLVVILRKARPPIPAPHPPLVSWEFQNGLFAAPWAQQPIRPSIPPELIYTFRPPLLPQFMPLRDSVKAAGGPPLEQLMRSIRDVAVFAWALAGINGNLVSHSHGLPAGESQPPEGLPIWDPNAGARSYLGPENQASQRWEELDRARGSGLDTSYGNQYVQEGRGYAQLQQQQHSMLHCTENYTYAQQPQGWSRPHVTHTTVYEPAPHPHVAHAPALNYRHFQQHHYPASHAPQQLQAQADTAFHGLPQEASSSSASSPVFPTPSQSGSSSDQGQGYRSLWR